jgi:hypothetical protein
MFYSKNASYFNVDNDKWRQCEWKIQFQGGSTLLKNGVNLSHEDLSHVFEVLYISVLI